MHDMGLRPNKPFRKCARVVGEVLGKYHPHGDQAVYDSLVRMVRFPRLLPNLHWQPRLTSNSTQAQDFVMGEPLVSGHGNFGSLDADPPAAMRYTECKLQPLADAMLLSDLSQATVKYIPNFDGSEDEPHVLPARLPNLLLNGSAGIAVGMATSIPPHNLNELVDALELVATRPEATLSEVLQRMPAPDFPTGGVIFVGDSLRGAYATGNGGATLRGKATVETLPGKPAREAVIITEIPYNGNKAALVTRLAELVNERVIEGVADIRDESDRDGMRVVLELRRGFDAATVMEGMFKHTRMSTRVSLNMIALVDGAPRTLGLLDMLRHFVDFRCDVIRKRAAAQLQAAEDRAHVVAGLRAALGEMDATVAAIRGAKDAAGAARALHAAIGLTDIQAAAVLAMPLRRLTGLEMGKLKEENDELTASIKDLRDLLAKEQRVIDVLLAEARELKAKYGRPRRTEVVAEVLPSASKGDSSGEDTDVPDVECLITVSERGYIKRMRPVAFSGPTGKAPMRPNRGKAGASLRADDALMRVMSCRDRDTVLMFTQKGRAFSLPAHAVPESSRTAVGTPLPQLLPFAPGETATATIAVSDFNHSLVMLTQRGWIKRMPLSELDSLRRRNAGLNALKLEAGDTLQFVRLCTEGDVLLIGSSDGHVIRFPINEAQLHSTSRNSRGVIAMDLRADATCVSMDVIPAGVLPTAVLPGFESGAESDGDAKGASGEDSDSEATPGRVAPPPYALLVTQQGYAKRVPVAAFRQVTRAKKGVIAAKLAPGDKLTSVRVVGVPPLAKRAKTRSARTRQRNGGPGGVYSDSELSDGEEEGGEGGSQVDEEEVVVATENGVISRCRVSEVRITGRSARGVRLVKLVDGDTVRTLTLLPGGGSSPAAGTQAGQ